MTSPKAYVRLCSVCTTDRRPNLTINSSKLLAPTKNSTNDSTPPKLIAPSQPNPKRRAVFVPEISFIPYPRWVNSLKTPARDAFFPKASRNDSCFALKSGKNWMQSRPIPATLHCIGGKSGIRDTTVGHTHGPHKLVRHTGTAKAKQLLNLPHNGSNLNKSLNQPPQPIDKKQHKKVPSWDRPDIPLTPGAPGPQLAPNRRRPA